MQGSTNTLVRLTDIACSQFDEIQIHKSENTAVNTWICTRRWERPPIIYPSFRLCIQCFDDVRAPASVILAADCADGELQSSPAGLWRQRKKVVNFPFAFGGRVSHACVLRHIVVPRLFDIG